MAEEKEKIVWNGDKGRTAEGREFRKSEDGNNIYERVDGEYVPYSSKEAGEVDTDTITWSGDYGRNATGRRFRKSGDLLYEYINGKYVPLNKPEGEAELANSKETTEGWLAKKLEKLPMSPMPRPQLTTGYKSIEQELPKREEPLPELEEKTKTIAFLDKLSKRK